MWQEPPAVGVVRQPAPPPCCGGKASLAVCWGAARAPGVMCCRRRRSFAVLHFMALVNMEPGIFAIR